MSGMRRDRYLNPATDEETDEVIQHAIERLASHRNMNWLGDAPNVLHLLASLIAQANQLLPTAVADARDQECTWAEIGDLLGVTRASAWQHYGGKTPTNRTPTQPD
jgi:hypothetical protein